MLTFLSDTWTGVLTAFRGAPTTLYVSFVAVIGGLILGFVLAFMRRSRAKVLRGVSTLYIDIVRGTPLLVQVLIVAYGIPALVNNTGGDFKWAQDVIPAMLCCGLNSAAYMGEIVRSGLNAVEKGQLEAAASLGMTHGQAMRLIVIPQALRIILPPLGNEFVTMIKETAILSYVGVVEITREGTLLSSRTYKMFEAYIGVAIVYIIFTIPLSKLILHFEKKMKMD